MVRKIRLHNFRNYGEKEIAFEPGINLIIGENGIGKTNLLEAIFILLEGNSMRTADIKEAIKIGEEKAAIGGWFGKMLEKKAEAEIDKEEGLRRKPVHGMTAVSYMPDDVYLVRGSPEVRRRYLDETSCRVKIGYREVIREYARILRQRNEAIKMVRKGAWGRESIRYWGPLLLERGTEITEERAEIIRKTGETVNLYGRDWGAETIGIKYYSNLHHGAAGMAENEEKLRNLEDAEIRRGMSLLGPHRDEMRMSYGGRNARSECSHGEQKIMSLLLKIAQAGIIEEYTGRKPVLLLDDCLSELDRRNRSALLRLLSGWDQVVITSTDDVEEARGIERIYL